MSATMNALIWQQFGAAIEMLENSITACPDEWWKKEPQFCQLAHHTLFFLHYYLSDDNPKESDYMPPLPFTKSEFEEVPPTVWYEKAELLRYAELGRRKLHEQLAGNIAEELLRRSFVNDYKDITLFELLLYNMRHVQHHAAQLNLLLRQHGIVPPDWVSKAKAAF